MFKKSLIGAAALSMLFTIGACKKEAAPSATDANAPANSEAPANPGDPANPAAPADAATAAAPLAAPAAPSVWNKAEVNALLAYIPADSTLYGFSTRNFDANSHQMMGLFSFLANYYDNAIKTLKENAPSPTDPDRVSFDAAIKDIEGALALIKDYKSQAADWGLDPDLHHDSVFYLAGTKLVSITSIADGDKFKAKLGTSFTSFGKLLKDAEIVTKEVGTGDNVWTIYALNEPIDGTQITPAVAFNITKTRVFLSVVSADVTEAELAELKNPAANPLTLQTIGTIGDRDASIAKMDNTKFLNLFNSPVIKAILSSAGDELISSACVTETQELFNSFPGVKFTQVLNEDNTMSFRAVILMNAKDELAKLNSLHTPSSDLLKAASLVGLKINLDLNKSLTYFTDVSSRISSKHYACPLYANIASSMKEIPEMLADPQIRAYSDGISGVNFSLDSLDMATQTVQGSVNVTGSKIGEIIPGVKLLASTVLPEFANLNKNQPLAIDLSAAAQMPLKINVAYTDTDLMVTTAPNDVMALTKLPKENRRHFIEFFLSTDLLDAVGGQEVATIMNDLKFKYTIAIGSNEEGIVIDSVYDFFIK